MWSNTYGQDKTANFIITINDVVVREGISYAALQFIGPDGSREVADVDYIPGKLQCHLGAVKEHGAKDSIILKFRYTRHCAADRMEKVYNIPFFRQWLDDSYIILRIYDLDLPKNRAFFASKPGLKYTYEVDTPGGGFKMIRKAGAKEPGCR